MDFHLSLGAFRGSSLNWEVLLENPPRMKRVKSKSNLFFSFLGVGDCPVGTGNVLGWKSLFPPGGGCDPNPIPGLLHREQEAINAPSQLLAGKRWNFFPAGMMDFCHSPWECSGKSGKSQCAVLEGFGCDGAWKNRICGRGKCGIALEKAQGTPGRGKLIGIGSWTLSHSSFPQHPTSLPTGNSGRDNLEFPQTFFSNFHPFLSLFCDPKHPQGPFPVGMEQDLGVFLFSMEFFLFSTALKPFSPRQCPQLPSGSVTSWGRTTSPPIPHFSRRWTRCSTTAMRWSGRNLPGEPGSGNVSGKKIPSRNILKWDQGTGVGFRGVKKRAFLNQRNGILGGFENRISRNEHCL